MLLTKKFSTLKYPGIIRLKNSIIAAVEFFLFLKALNTQAQNQSEGLITPQKFRVQHILWAKYVAEHLSTITTCLI